MFDVVLDISGLSIEDLIARVRAIKTGVAGQAAFSSLAAKLTALEALTDTLETKQQAIAPVQAVVAQKVLERDAAETPVINAVTEIAQDVGKLAPDEATVAATTMRVKNKPGPKPIPSKPSGLEVTVGDEEGEISGQCNGQPGIVDYYEQRWTTGDPNAPATTWTAGETSKKSYFELKPLPSGQKVWVQIRACNARGKSPWSDPACVRVP